MSTCRITRGNIVIIGSGPGAYEAALVAKQIGAAVTLINRDGIGSTAVITDCVPSERINRGTNLQTVNARVRDLAHAQSTDITAALVREGVEIVNASGSFINANTVVATHKDGATVGVSQKELGSGEIRGDMYLLPLATSARAKKCRRKMTVSSRFFAVKLHALTLGIQERLTIDELASAFTVFEVFRVLSPKQPDVYTIRANRY